MKCNFTAADEYKLVIDLYFSELRATACKENIRFSSLQEQFFSAHRHSSLIEVKITTVIYKLLSKVLLSVGHRCLVLNA